MKVMQGFHYQPNAQKPSVLSRRNPRRQDHGSALQNVSDYLNPKSMQNNSPKPIIIGIKAIILHTFGGPGSAINNSSMSSM